MYHLLASIVMHGFTATDEICPGLRSPLHPLHLPPHRRHGCRGRSQGALPRRLTHWAGRRRRRQRSPRHLLSLLPRCSDCCSSCLSDGSNGLCWRPNFGWCVTMGFFSANSFDFCVWMTTAASEAAVADQQAHRH